MSVYHVNAVLILLECRWIYVLILTHLRRDKSLSICMLSCIKEILCIL